MGFKINKYSDVKNIYWDGITVENNPGSGLQFDFVGSSNLTVKNLTAPQGYSSGWSGFFSNNYEDALWQNIYRRT